MVLGKVLRSVRSFSQGSVGPQHVRVPWIFAAKALWSQQTAILRKEKYRPYHYGAALLLAGASWYMAYDYLTDRIDRSSLIVRQTLFNIKCDERITALLGTGINISSRLAGTQSQGKAIADIQFTVVGSKELPAAVRVIAERKGWDWNTQYLEVIPQGMASPIVLYNSMGGDGSGRDGIGGDGDDNTNDNSNNSNSNNSKNNNSNSNSKNSKNSNNSNSNNSNDNSGNYNNSKCDGNSDNSALK